MNSFVLDEQDYSILLDFKNCQGTFLTPKEAIKKYINELVRKYPPPYTLFASGGIDSQVMIHSFIHADVPFKIKSVRFANNLNQHDLKTLDKFALANNLFVQYEEIDIIDFFENNLIEYVKQYKCSSPQICAHMNWVDKFAEGTCVFSGVAPCIWGLEFTQDNLPFYDYAVDKPLIPFFLLQDSEVCSAFFNLQRNILDQNRNQPSIDEMLPQGYATYHFKSLLYKAAGFEIIPQDLKLSGFELVKEYYDNFPERVTKFDRLKYSDRPSPRIFDIIFRYKMEDITKVNRKTFRFTLPELYKYSYVVY